MPGYDDLFEKATQKLDSVANAQDNYIEEKPQSPYEDLMPEEEVNLTPEEEELTQQIQQQTEQEREEWQEYEDLPVHKQLGRTIHGAFEGSKGRLKYSAAEAFRDGNYIKAVGKGVEFGMDPVGTTKRAVNDIVSQIFGSEKNQKIAQAVNKSSNPLTLFIDKSVDKVKEEAADFNEEQYRKLIESSNQNMEESERLLAGAHGWTYDVGSVVPQVGELAGVIAVSTIAPPLAPAASGTYLSKMGVETYGGGLMEYDRYMEETDQEWNEYARQGVGLANAASEVLAERFLGGISRYMPKTVRKGFGQYAINKLMKSKAGRETIENATRRFAAEQPKMWESVAKGAILQAERGLAEGGEEMLTGIAQHYIHNLYKEAEDKADLGDLGTEMWQSFKGGFLMSLMLGPVSGGANRYTRNKLRNNQGVALAMTNDGEVFEVLGEKDGQITGLTRKGAEIEVSPENIVDQAYMTNQELKDYLAGQRQGIDQTVFEQAATIRNKQTGNIDLVWTMTMQEDAMPYSLIETNGQDAVVVDNETGERKVIPQSQISKNVSVPFNDYLEARKAEVNGIVEQEDETEAIEKPEVDLSPGNTIEIDGRIGHITEVSTDGTILLDTEQGTVQITQDQAQNARPATIIELDAETQVPAIETENGLEVYEEFIDEGKAAAVRDRLNELFQGKRVFEMIPFDNENPNQPNKIKVVGRQYEAEPAPGIEDAGSNNQGPEAIQPEQPAPQTPDAPEGSGGAQVEAPQQERRTITDGKNELEVSDLGNNAFQVGDILHDKKEAADLRKRLQALYGRKLNFDVEMQESDDPFDLDNYRVVAEPKNANEAESEEEINPQVDLPDYSINRQEVSRGMAKLAIKKAKSPEDIAGLQIKDDAELQELIAEKFPAPEYLFEGEPLTREEVAAVIENAQSIEELEGIEIKNDPVLEAAIQEKFAPEQENEAGPAEEQQDQQAGDVIENNVQNRQLDRAGQEVEQNPTEAQKEAGNYKKGHIKVQGLDITIENPKGSNRAGVDGDGNAWSRTMNNHYGYFKRSKGKDGDQVDVFIGDNPTSTKVFAIDQINPKTGEFDEHKILLGFNSAREARDAYLSNYEEGWQGIGDIAETDIEGLKDWLKNGDTKSPLVYEQPDQPGVEAEEKPSPEGEAASEPITPESIEQRIIQHIEDNMMDEALYSPADVINNFFNTGKRTGFLSKQQEFKERKENVERYKEFKEALDNVNRENIVNHFKQAAEKQKNAHNRLVGMVRDYNSTPNNHTNKLANKLNDISRIANQLGYRVGQDDSGKLAVFNGNGKPIRTIPTRQSREEIEAHKALSDYPQEFQDFVNNRFEQEPEQFGVYYPLSKKERLSAIKAIQEGRKTVAANTMLDRMEEFYDSGYVEYVEYGGHIVRLSIEELNQLQKEQEQDALVEKLKNFSYLDYDKAFEEGIITEEQRDLLAQVVQQEILQDEQLQQEYEANIAGERNQAQREDKAKGQGTGNPSPEVQKRIKQRIENEVTKREEKLQDNLSQARAKRQSIKNKMDNGLNKQQGIFDQDDKGPKIEQKAAFDVAPDGSKKNIDDQLREANAEVNAAERELTDFAKRKQGLIDQIKQSEMDQGGLFAGDYLKRKPKNKQNKPENKPKNKTKGESNKVFTKSAKDEALERLRKKRGNLNVGIDPQEMVDAITVAGFHIEAGARTFKDFAQRMIEDVGAWIKPYLKGLYENIRRYPGMESVAEEMDNSQDVDNFDVETIKPQDDAEYESGDIDQDSPGGENENNPDGADVPNTPGEDRGEGREGNINDREGNKETPEYNDEAAEDGINDLGGATPIDREGGNNGLRGEGEGRRSSGNATGSNRSGRGGYFDSKRKTKPDGQRDGGDGVRDGNADGTPSPVRRGNLEDIQKTLPELFPEQQDDVLRAEQRFFTGENTGKGKLFTNGTGTGKTYTGLGIAKRFMLEGKTNILFVVPTDAKAKDWIEEGTNLNVSLTQLRDTKDNGGDGPIVTTYANFYQNESLNSREFDLVVYDEAHYLGQNEGGDATNAFKKHRLVANLPSAARTKAELIAGERPSQPEESRFSQIPEVEKQWEQYDNNLKAWNDRYEKAYRELVDKTKVVFLSATPFAYHKSLAWGDGTLFEISEGVETQEDRYLGYNEAGGFAKFLTENLGYRMRYNKATIPESGVDVSLLERQLFEKFVEEGVFTGRQLKVDKDYSREFIDVGTELGEKINEGMKEMSQFNREFAKKYPILSGRAHKKWNFLYMNQLMEGIKANNSVDRIQEHLDLGRKVVVFHGYNNALPSHPFRFTIEELFTRAEMADPKNVHAMAQAEAEIADFEIEYPQYANMSLNELSNPRRKLSEVFGDRMREFNGTIPKKKRFGYIAEFNDENSGVDLLVVQRKAGKEGISLHDKNGTKQRVLVDLGLPTAPTDAIQSEGRIYRLGVQSNAIFEYPIINTDFERYQFAMKVAERSKTAENLAMGNRARNLQNAFIEGYSNPTDESPNENQGQGGKEFDEQVLDVSEFDQAKTFYFARGKKSSSNKSSEGVDYFATPEPVGYKMAEWLGLEPNEKGMEPSAGHGAIARFFPGHANNTFIEPSFKLSSQLAMVANGDIKQSTFEDLHKVNKFHGIAMNPPFGKSGKTAMEHVEKAFGHLYDGGRIVAIVPNGPAMQKRLDEFLYGENDKGKLNNPSAVLRAEITLPGVTFERAATKVGTKIVVIDRVEDEETRQTLDSERRVDLSDVSEIGELFDRVEDMNIPQRVDTGNNVVEEQEQQSPVEKSSEPSDVFGEVEEYEHTKTGQILYNVPLNGRIDNFSEVAAIARNNNPYNKRKAYSRYSKGFLFENEADANNFRREVLEAGNDDGGRFKKARFASEYLTELNKQRKDKDHASKVINEAESVAKEYGVKINVVPTADDIPITAKLSQSEKGDVQGYYDPNTGELYLASNNVTREEARKIALHEVIGHKGLRKVLGDKLNPVLDRVYNSIPDVDRESLEAIYGTNKRDIAEEYIAELAEKYKRPNFIRRIVAQIRNMIRKAFGISYSTNDIMYLLSRSENAIKRDKGDGYVSTKNAGDGNPLQFGENPMRQEGMFKRRKPKQESTADLRKFGDRTREKAQDRMITLKRLQQEVINRGGKVEWFQDAYAQENRSHGRILYETERVGKQLVDPLIKAVYDVTGSNKAEDLAEIQRYMKAKHAPERNRVISKKKELDEVENQSGFTDEEAAEIVEAYEAGKDPKAIEALWNNVRNLTNYTLNRWLSDGFISKDTYESLTKGEDAYQYYVPLRGFADVGESVFKYQNKDASKVVSPLREAKGRESESDDPIQYMVNMAQTAIVMGENNRIKQYAYRMVKDNSPSDPEQENNFKDLFHMKKAYYVSTGVKDSQGNDIVNVQYERPGQELFDRGLVQTRFNNRRMALNNAQNKEHEVTVMVNGERITIAFENPEVANAINKDNIRRLPEGFFGDILRGTGRLTRWLTANFTAKNPAFIAPNTVRDVAYAMLSHAIKGSGKDAARFAKHIAMITTRNIGTSGVERDTKYGKYYREFMENGAATGYVHLKDVDQIARDVDKALTRAKRGKDGSFIFNSEGYLRMWKKAGEIMDVMAQKSENMSRLATYIMAREDGKTPAEAATEAKNITVNFNRKGTESTLFGSLYAFMNAAIQGGENIARLAKEHKGKFVGAAASMYAWGFLTALLSHINDDEEDNPNNYANINDYMKQTNFTLRYGKDRYISIPLPHGWRVFYGMGVSTMENLFLDEGKKSKFNWAREDRAWDKMIFDFIDSSIDATSSVNPMDAFGDEGVTLSGAIKVITPTAAMPIADIATNRDFAGRRIRREPFTSQLKELEANAGNYKRNVNFVLKGLTDKLYQAGGGDVDIYAKKVLKDGELKKVGWLYDWNPSNIEHLVTYLTGGRGRFYNQLIKTTSSVVAGASNWAAGDVEGMQEVDMNDVPIINRFNRQSYDYGMYNEYYSLKDDIAAYNYAINNYGIEKKAQNINPHMEMMDDMVKGIDKQLKGLREMRSMVANQPEKWKELKEQEKQIIENFLNSIDYDNRNK